MVGGLGEWVMFQALFIAHAVIGGLLTVGVSYAGIRIGWLWRRDTVGALRRAARGYRWFVGGFGLLLLAAFGVGFSLLKYDWSFGQAWLIVALLLLVAAAGGLWAGVMPRLAALAGPADDASDESRPPARLRAAAADPGLVVPVRAAALWIWAVLYLMMERPALVQSVVIGLIALVAGSLLRLAQRITAAGVAAGQPSAGRRRWVVLLAPPAVLLLGAGGWAGWSWQDSQLPGTMSMAMPGGSMAGMAAGQMSGMSAGTSVATLTTPAGPADDSFTLTARDQRVRLASGASVAAVTFNGQAPGPKLTVHQGDLVQVTLVNDSSLPTSLHWHGVAVPNAEDGVPGVTQDAVRPGGRLVYRFRVPAAGTYWYHSHEQSSVQVLRGLFGPLVVLPRAASPAAGASGFDQVVTAHTWQSDHGDRLALDTTDGVSEQRVAAGTPVRLRLLNTDNKPRAFTLAGASFEVAAIDGDELAGPTPLTDTKVSVPAGGRYDLTFTMPARPVRLAALNAAGVAIDYRPPGVEGAAPTVRVGADFALDRYGAHQASSPAGISLATRFTRDYTVALDQRPGFHDGQLDPNLYLINGRLDPYLPPFMLTQGDLVKLTFVNRTMADHPFHLHGHRLTVLSHDGRPLSGSPVELDTLNLEPGSTWVVGFRADNPGLWMFHCHNLDHAAKGMMAMFDYTGYTSPYLTGRDTGNIAE
jgi:FtsP/CotA-like multicopper oxidase with cupredoxin domain